MQISGNPSCGEVWWVDFGDPVGHEQGFRRPALIVSSDGYNQTRAGLHIVVPLTTRDKGLRVQVPVAAGEAGLPAQSYIKCDDIRSVSIRRLGAYLGRVTPETMRRVEYQMRLLLNL